MHAKLSPFFAHTIFVYSNSFLRSYNTIYPRRRCFLCY